MGLTTVEQAIEDVRAGRFVIIVDDEDRENEGDFAMAAEFVTAESINFVTVHARGLICVPMSAERLRELDLDLMVSRNTSRNSTAFTVSVDLSNGGTGISAADRAATVRALVDPATDPGDLARPGHMFPLRAQGGGVLVRAGQTEAIVDLARMAGLQPAGIVCEIMNEDGTMARRPQLEVIAAPHGINIVSVAQIIAYRLEHEHLVQKVAEARLPTAYGEARAIAYRSEVDAAEHVALVFGNVETDEPVLVRVHSECLTGDVFGSLRCDCGIQRDMAIKAIAEEGRGVFLYMRQEGRGIGLHNKIRAYALQDDGADTVEANEELGFPPDLRHYGIGAQILVDLGVRKMRLLTNNPKKVVGLESYGLSLVERVPIVVESNPENERYLAVKRQKLGHLLDALESPTDLEPTH
ncbi:MAG: bifunctional 3,4-dihydroxy-2-butanone-4-phosphate synthase/GTP cyclohydrolase II [Chloroflexi bacterium]|nr:bifunctional 3,4-dihydroxy-2-butanone-4-phosphate synthase/GTP cyclohydrolase II [Chloroflexota bacterium]